MISDTIFKLSIFVLIILSISLLNFKHIAIVFKKFLPTLFFFPIMLVIYILFSLLLTDASIFQTIKEALIALIKFSLMIISMNFYLQLSTSENLINALRSFWLNANIKWRWVDNFFLFLGLTLRFYPTFQSQWHQQRESQKALGIKFNESYYGRLIEISRELPSMLIYQLNRSEDISLAMKLRGYGNNFPRRIVEPIYFNYINLLQIILITIFFIYIIRFVTI
jgi:hypothetical protein